MMLEYFRQVFIIGRKPWIRSTAVAVVSRAEIEFKCKVFAYSE